MSATALSKECGLAQSTLSRWLRDASTVPSMASSNDEVRESRGPKRWAAADIVTLAAGLPESQLGELLRREGLHMTQIEDWRQSALAGLSTTKASRKPSPDAKKIRELERDLNRKNRALAEVTALLTLQKKVQAIWGDADENTQQNNET
jgi:transcriptional regulator with XRE-family HTH domain